MQHTDSHITPSQRTGRRSLRPRILRSLSPAAVAIAASLLIGGAGLADGAIAGAAR